MTVHPPEPNIVNFMSLKKGFYPPERIALLSIAEFLYSYHPVLFNAHA
jgi:hypothetical protein